MNVNAYAVTYFWDAIIGNLKLSVESNFWRVPHLENEAQKNRSGSCPVRDLSTTV